MAKAVRINEIFMWNITIREHIGVLFRIRLQFAFGKYSYIDGLLIDINIFQVVPHENTFFWVLGGGYVEGQSCTHIPRS